MKGRKVDLFFILFLVGFGLFNLLGFKVKCPFNATDCNRIFCGQKANILCCKPQHFELLPLFGRETAMKIWNFLNEKGVTSLGELSQIQGIGKRRLEVLEGYFFVSERCEDF